MDEQNRDYKYVYGPVPSRRFGRSLGIDLTPFKTCCQDCVFCQLGPTTNKTLDRREYVPTEAVLAEIQDWLASGGEADYIALSGSGEPTLHSGFGDVLEFIRKETDIPTALLTNGALLYLPEVRKAASGSSVVKVSVSAWDQISFEWVNRPLPDLRFSRVISGLKAFRDVMLGQLWMEVFLVQGMNTLTAAVDRLAQVAQDLTPDRIHLNTAVRPSAEAFVQPLSTEEMRTLSRKFQPEADVIPEFSGPPSEHYKADKERIFTMLRRRPCTAKQIAEGFGMNLSEVLKDLEVMVRGDRVLPKRTHQEIYYTAANQKHEHLQMA